MGPNTSKSQPVNSIQDLLSQLAKSNLQAKLPGKKSSGGSFSDLEIASVWNKAMAIPGYDMRFWRRDACGAAIYRSNYGLTVDTGWEIDHITPVAHNGNNDLANLQPLQWRNNRYKGDSLSLNYCVVPRRS